MSALISIIIPVYNKEKYVKKAIESCVNQTYENIEIILIDDGSSDGSSLICKDYAATDIRIKYYYQTNKGASFSRNKGISLANGDWLVFLDADDILSLDFCEECLSRSEAINADILFVSSKDVSEEKEEIIRVSNKEYCLWENEEIKQLSNLLLVGSSKELLYNYTLDGPCCKIIRKSIVGKSFFPENIDLCEDTCFIAQLLESSRIIYFYNKVLYTRIIAKDSLSYSPDEKRARRIVDYCFMLKICVKYSVHLQLVLTLYKYYGNN